MKVFPSRELNKAKAYAMQGGQALHIHRTGLGGRAQFASYWEIGHLFDQNLTRLITTARALGVRLIKVQEQGTELQHIQLCGRPLKRAKELCQRLAGYNPRVARCSRSATSAAPRVSACRSLLSLPSAATNTRSPDRT